MAVGAEYGDRSDGRYPTWAAFPGWLSMAFVCLFSENSDANVCTAPADGREEPAQMELSVGDRGNRMKRTWAQNHMKSIEVKL